MNRSIVRKPFGTMPDGCDVELYILTNQSGMQVSIATYGGIVTSLTAPDYQGRFADIVLGFDNFDQYLFGHPYFGAIVGRYGNRISNGTFVLDDRPVSIAKNNAGNHLHGGISGFDKKLWKAQPQTTLAGPQLQLSYISKDGEEGFPGQLEVVVTYTLTNDNDLRIDYQTTTDKPTHVNLTNHSYFNLAGPESRNVLNHLVTINADLFTPIDPRQIPTGELRNVEGTAMDFRVPVSIGARIGGNDEQLQFANGYDHNWVLNKKGTNTSFAARVFEPTTGRVMEVHTSEPGIQFYTANFLDGSLTGKAGIDYGRRCAYCLETQHYPDSPNKPGFPSTVLRPGEVYETTTEYRFFTESVGNDHGEISDDIC